MDVLQGQSQALCLRLRKQWPGHGPRNGLTAPSMNQSLLSLYTCVYICVCV